MQRQHINRKIWLALLPAIRNRISSGENRRTIFDDLSAKYIEQDRIAALIAGKPSTGSDQAMCLKTEAIIRKTSR